MPQGEKKGLRRHAKGASRRTLKVILSLRYAEGQKFNNLMGVRSGISNKASGVNSNGHWCCKISSRRGLGAVTTKFRSSSGGAGRGLGSGSESFGLGGLGKTRSFGLGEPAAVNKLIQRYCIYQAFLAKKRSR